MKNIDSIKKKIEESQGFYDKFLKIDKKQLLYSFDTIKAYFNGSTALEIGPAHGDMTKLLKDEFKNLHILEASKPLLDKIPNYKNIVKHHNLIENFDSDLKFDTIIMGHVLEHIADPIVALKKIYSLLKNDGTFIVSVPNAKSLHRMVAVEMDILENEYKLNSRDIELGHYRVYDMSILESHLKTSGFNIDHMGGYFLKPLSNGQIENNWNDEMVEGFYKIGKHFQKNCAEIYAVCSK
jgi:2-polyprenyl-3-methyl-5-hydroxy-6-metoxy-1,4-benzoquinol methylase